MAVPYRYVVSDLDGTLLAPNHVISDATRDTLKTLVHQYGITPIIATGRHYADIKVIAENLKQHIWGDGTTIDDAPPPSSPSRAPMMYLITSNGAVVHNAVTHEVVFQTCLDPVVAERLYRYLPESEEVVNANLYQGDDWFARIAWAKMNDYCKESGIEFIHLPVAPPLSAEPVPSTSATGVNRGIAVGNYDNISKVFFIAEDLERLNAVVPEVKALTQACGCGAASMAFSSATCLDVMAEGVCKGQALRRLFEVILHPKEGKDVVAEALQSSIAFGDGMNDAEMLMEVGKGCVMGNANPLLKAQHPELEVILSNAEDGVSRKLRSVFSLSD